MKILNRMFAFGFLGLLLLAGCKHVKKGVPALSPNVLFFLVEKDGQKLPDSVLRKIVLFYVGPGGAIHDRLSSTSDDTSLVSPGSRFSAALDSAGVLCSGYVDGSFFAEGVHDWYLKYPDGDIDTLYIEVTDIGAKEGAKDRCHCERPFTVVRFNGKDAPETTEVTTDNGKPVYLFEK